MNRIEIVGLFSALNKMLQKGQYEDVKEIVEDVLNEAKSKKKSDYKKPRIDDDD